MLLVQTYLCVIWLRSCNSYIYIYVYTVETEVDGSALVSKSCVRCAPGTQPSIDRAKCLPCPVTNCTCPPTTHELLLDGKLCVFRANLTSWPDEKDTYLAEYDAVGMSVESDYMKKHLRAFLHECVKVKKKKTIFRNNAYSFNIIVEILNYDLVFIL